MCIIKFNASYTYSYWNLSIIHFQWNSESSLKRRVLDVTSICGAAAVVRKVEHVSACWKSLRHSKLISHISHI